MILLDTHVWYWFITESDRLEPRFRPLIEAARADGGYRVSIISFWEIAQKAASGKMGLNRPIAEWFGFALADPKLIVEPLTPSIVIDATALPGELHKDPADRLIIATARSLNCPLATNDARITGYAHVLLA